MFTTSYKSEGMDHLLTALVRTVNPSKVIEFGTQQGHSAVLLAKGMKRGVVKTYDIFESNYPNPPHKETHADMLKALHNVEGYNIEVYAKDVFEVKPVRCDVLHIDICNHQKNVYPLLHNWQDKVSKMIILEGGVLNKWQKKYGFKPFVLPLRYFKDWRSVIIKGENGYAITILTRL